MTRIPFLIATSAIALAMLGGCNGRDDRSARHQDKNTIEERSSPVTIRTQREEPTDQNATVGVVDVPPNTGGSVIEPTHW